MMPQPKKTKMKAYADNLTARESALQEERNNISGDLVAHVLAFPGMEEIFATDDQKRMLEDQLARMVENTVRIKIENERQQAVFAQQQAEFERQQAEQENHQ